MRIFYFPNGNEIRNEAQIKGTTNIYLLSQLNFKKRSLYLHKSHFLKLNWNKNLKPEEVHFINPSFLSVSDARNISVKDKITYH